MEKWRLIISEPLSGAENMAIDEAIMLAVGRGAAPPTIRFYRWSPAALTLGYFQNIEKEVDIAACKSAGVDVVRRLTGGRAVLHRHELTYSLAAPDDNEKISGSVLRSYLSISRGLLKGLSRLGVEAELAEGKNKSETVSPACFDAPSWYELVAQGKKLVGSAQTRRNGCLLQHGSVLLKADTETLFFVLNFASEKLRERAKDYFQAKATCLEEIMGYSPEFEVLCDRFKYGFESELGIELKEQQITEAEAALAQELSAGKYGTDEWNRRK